MADRTIADWRQRNISRADCNRPAIAVALQAGDVVAVTGYGLEYEGMVNMNQQHMVGKPHLTFSVLETGMQLPAPTVTTLPQLMNSSSDFYFDPTRQTGAEHLQGTLVQLDGVHVLLGHLGPQQPGRPQRRHRAADDLEHRKQPGPRGSAHGGLQHHRN